jgi:hypothetical protein
MVRGFLVVALVALLGACTQRLVCPAYQSSFIYDKEAVRQKFSYFKEDSTPKVYTASKNKYLVAVPESYRKKYRKMQTVEMTPVYPVKSDSLKNEFHLAEADSADSTAQQKTNPADTIYAITKTKERYNLDQDLYMWYFREMLVLPDVRASMEKKAESKENSPAAKKEKKGIAGFFKNLFKKKPKTDSTGAAITPPPTADVNGPEQPKKKRGGLFKKKAVDPTPKKKEGGDGF